MTLSTVAQEAVPGLHTVTETSIRFLAATEMGRTFGAACAMAFPPRPAFFKGRPWLNSACET